MTQLDDASLVARAVAGDAAAFEDLVTRHHRVLFSVALRMLGERADAHDATQSAFVKAYEGLRSYDPRFRFFSWIYRILVNECLNVRRNRRPVEEVTPELAAVNGTPLDALESVERRKRVQAALQQLPPDYRQVLVLRHFAELSYDDIAEALGVPAKTVKSRLYTARQRMIDLLLDK
jgi:RNA polymerase sigma-70 factor (ECF subfamily)